MARKNYTDEFRRRAEGLYESTADATLKGIASVLISRGALKEWVDKLGSGPRRANTARPAPVSVLGVAGGEGCRAGG